MTNPTVRNYLREYVDDQGENNSIELSDVWGGAGDRNRRTMQLLKDSRKLHERDSVSVLMGHTDIPFVSGNDLLLNPVSWSPTGLTEGASYSILADSTTDLGHRMNVASPGSWNILTNSVNGEASFTIGEFLPPSNVRFYIKAKAGQTATQAAFFDADPVGGTSWESKGSKVLNWTTSYAVQYFDVDLKGLTSTAALRIRFNALSPNDEIDIAWIALVPFQNIILNQGGDVGGFNALTYSATIATDSRLARHFKITVTDTSAFTISNPTNVFKGQTITYDILNSSGGVMGALTWGGDFALAGAFTNPADTKRRTISYYYDNAKWVELSRTAADI